MRHERELVVIYGIKEFLSCRGLFVFGFFDRQGVIDSLDIEEILSVFYSSQQVTELMSYSSFLGPFNSKEELFDFVQEFAREKKYTRCVLLTLDEFNIALEQSADAQGILEFIEGHGVLIQTDNSVDKKGLIRGFFG